MEDDTPYRGEDVLSYNDKMYHVATIRYIIFHFRTIFLIVIF